MIKNLLRLKKKNNNKINIEYAEEHKDYTSDLFYSYKLLLSEDFQVVRKVIDTFKYLIDKNNLFKFEESFRKSIRLSHQYDYNFWTQLNPHSIIDKDNYTTSERINILGISSLHSNGYYRQRALDELSKFNTGEELKFIVVRTNDWVSKISQKATRICLNRMRQETIQSIFENVFYFIKLIEFNRVNHQDLINELNRLFNKKENLDYVLEGLKHKNSKIRKYFYELSLNKNHFNINQLVPYLQKEREAYLKYLVFNQLFENMSKEEFLKLYPHFIYDKNRHIKFLILFTLEKLKVNNLEERIYPFIFDRHYSIREYARYILIKYQDYDFKNIYQNELLKNKNIYSSINGLAEVGDKSVVPLIINYLSSPTIKIVKTVLKAVARLDFNQYKSLYLRYLNDDRVGISKTAYLIIKENIYDYREIDIYNIYTSCSLMHIKKFSVKLLISLSKWTALKYILEFLLDKDETIYNLAHFSLENWVSKYNKTFITPTQEEIKAITTALNKVQDLIKKETLEFLLLVLMIE